MLKDDISKVFSVFGSLGGGSGEKGWRSMR